MPATQDNISYTALKEPNYYTQYLTQAMPNCYIQTNQYFNMPASQDYNLDLSLTDKHAN